MMRFHPLLRLRHAAFLGFTTSVCLGLVASAGYASFWDSFFNSPPPDPPSPGGSRGPYFCAIAPYSGEMLVQGEQPRFLWQGSTERVEVRRAGEPEAIWSASVSSADERSLERFELESPLLNGVTYELAPADLTLDPGQAYEFWVYPPSYPASRVEFETLSAQQQQQINQERDRLAAGDDAGSILERADYFARVDLWPSFWSQVFSVPAPPAELADVLEAELEQICRLSR